MFWVVLWVPFSTGGSKNRFFFVVVCFCLWFSLCVSLLTDFRFDRDWKKIEAFVGSKTVIQVNFIPIRSGREN